MSKPPSSEQADAEQIILSRQAVENWQRLRPNSPEPRRVTQLSRKRRRVVYRLEGVGPGDSAVIAKRCPRESAELEAFIYNEVLSQLPLQCVQCYGVVSEHDDQYSWLFLEDGGTTTLGDLTESVPTAISHCLGVLHSSTSATQTLARRLPDRSPAYYLATLRTARQGIEETLSKPDVRDEDRAGLENLVSCLEMVEDGWDGVSQRCAALPWSLVHGDFQLKNVLARRSTTGFNLLTIDWEYAGWGPPAVDLARLELAASALDRASTDPYARWCAEIDCASYWHAVQGTWPGVELRDVEEQARCGMLFKWLAAVGWETERLRVGSWRAQHLGMYVPLVRASAQILGL